MNIALKWVVTVLVVVAVIFGYQIYMRNGGSISSAPVSTTTASTSATDLLNSPANTAPDNEKRAYAKLVIDAAIPTTTIDISSCSAKPTVSSFPDESSVTLSNTDSVEHHIVFDANTVFLVPAKSSKIIKANFGKGAGIYGFGCDDSRKAVGMVFVTPK